LASVWVAVAASSGVALLCHLLALNIGRFQRWAGEELPLVSRWFFYDAVAVYLFPIPLGIWAAHHCIRSRDHRDLSYLIVAVALGWSLVFLALFLRAVVLPFLPIGRRMVPDL